MATVSAEFWPGFPSAPAAAGAQASGEEFSENAHEGPAPTSHKRQKAHNGHVVLRYDAVEEASDKSRKGLACGACYLAKAKCDGQRPCSRCVRIQRPLDCHPRDRKKKIAVACMPCHIARRPCTHERPCPRCVRLKIEDKCRNPDTFPEVVPAPSHRPAARPRPPALAVPLRSAGSVQPEGQGQGHVHHLEADGDGESEEASEARVRGEGNASSPESAEASAPAEAPGFGAAPVVADGDLGGNPFDTSGFFLASTPGTAQPPPRLSSVLEFDLERLRRQVEESKAAEGRSPETDGQRTPGDAADAAEASALAGSASGSVLDPALSVGGGSSGKMPCPRWLEFMLTLANGAGGGGGAGVASLDAACPAPEGAPASVDMSERPMMALFEQASSDIMGPLERPASPGMPGGFFGPPLSPSGAAAGAVGEAPLPSPLRGSGLASDAALLPWSFEADSFTQRVLASPVHMESKEPPFFVGPRPASPMLFASPAASSSTSSPPSLALTPFEQPPPPPAAAQAVQAPQTPQTPQLWRYKLMRVWRDSIGPRLRQALSSNPSSLPPTLQLYLSALARHLAPEDFQDIRRMLSPAALDNGGELELMMGLKRLHMGDAPVCGFSAPASNMHAGMSVPVVSIDLRRVDNHMKSDLFMNDLAERLLGYSAKDVLTMFCNGKLQTRTSQCPTMKVTDPQTRLLLWWIVAPEDMEEQMRLEMMVMLGLEEEASARIRVRTKDGRSVPCIENARQVRDVHRLEPGVIASIFFTFTPIPEP